MVKEHNKRKGVQMTIFQYTSNAQYVPRQEFEQLALQVKELQMFTPTYNATQDKLVFAEEILQKLPSVVRKTVKGVMLNFENDFPDFCFWGMRKALIDAMNIRFKMDGEEERLYSEDGEPLSLPKWIELAKQKRYISSHDAKNLISVKAFGDAASHNYMVNLQKEEVPPILNDLRIALSRMYP